MVLDSVRVEEQVDIKGISFPAGVRFRQIVVTGPPGSGKTTLINTLGGWPQEGYLDLGQKGWWHSPLLAYRPREVHLGFPFAGYTDSHAVFDNEWLASPAPIDFERLRLPPERGWWPGTRWRRKYVFDILLPPAEAIYAIRTDRARIGSHPVDAVLSERLVQDQVAVYAELARYFQLNGMRVFVRRSFGGPPERVLG